MWRKSEDSKPEPVLESPSESKSVSNSPAQQASPQADASGGPATVNRGIIIKGEISGQGDFFLDGAFEGTVRIPDGMFTVGPNGHVTAEIEAREIIVRGEVVGSLRARERVHISSTGRLTGDMDTRGIVVEDGAILHSKVATPRAAAAEEATSKIVVAEATSADSLPEKVMPERADTSPRAKGAAAASGDS
ncbi:MAG TPA: polymer-forming cytoskeletal protein [Candidatus Dormibacteraeota bacterium]|nr:polymer-forming cytoskeletal protein [Candidatus Dormibacteraeota bacterium]